MSALKTTKGALIVILLLAVIFRVGAAFYLGNEVTSLPGTADQVSYHALALRVLDGQGFSFGENWWPVTVADAPTAHWSYLYTLYLVVVYALFGPNPLTARLIQAVIAGVLQPYLAFYVTTLITSSSDKNIKRLAPLLAAAITAGYVYFVYYSAVLMTEPFFIVAVVAALAQMIRLVQRIHTRNFWIQAVILGVFLGTAVLLRQIFLLVVPFVFLWLAIAAYRSKALGRALGGMAIATFFCCLFILPFTLYNFSRFDRFVLLNTNAGYAFFWANHPVYGTHFQPASEMGTTYQDLVPDELRNLDEASLERELLRRGVQFVIDEPGRYLQLSLSRIPAYFKFWPDGTSTTISNVSRLASFALFLPFMIYGLVRPLITSGSSETGGLYSIRPVKSNILLLYLFVLIYTTVHILSWAQIRYRLPVDAVLVIFAALAITDLARKVSVWERARREKKQAATSVAAGV